MINVLDFPLPYWPSVAAAECDYYNAMAHAAAASESFRETASEDSADYYLAAKRRVEIAEWQAQEARFRELRATLYERGRV